MLLENNFLILRIKATFYFEEKVQHFIEKCGEIVLVLLPGGYLVLNWVVFEEVIKLETSLYE